jgi:acetolactate synthase-1/3 small subunit
MSRLYTLSIFSENSPGVLHRVVTLFTRRKINIESLTVSETEQHSISRFTIVARLDEQLVETVVRQLRRIVEVRDAFASLDADLLFKEIAFFKVDVSSREKLLEVEEHAKRYGAAVIHAEPGYMVLEKTGSEHEITSLFTMLEPLGMKEFVRSGRIAIRMRDEDVEQESNGEEKSSYQPF